MGPSIVCVFPDPVWPYANIHVFSPSRAVCTKGLISSNNSSYVESGKNTWSKLYTCGVWNGKVNSNV